MLLWSRAQALARYDRSALRSLERYEKLADTSASRLAVARRLRSRLLARLDIAGELATGGDPGGASAAELGEE
jgi:hypothetical protein